MKMKICTKCKKEQPLSEFNKNKNFKDGLCYWCKKCCKEQQREYYLNNKEKINKRAIIWKLKNPIKDWCAKTISFHKRKGFKVLFTWKELLPIAKQTKTCTICDIKLSWEIGKGLLLNSPTLDRVNNENTLNLDNIQILCWRCNSTKLNRTMKEFVEYCEMIYQKFGTLVVIPINHWIKGER